MLSNLFLTSTNSATPQDGNVTVGENTASLVSVSDFVTVQGLTNFSVMTGAIFAAWHALQLTGSWADSRWCPLAMCAIYGAVAITISDPVVKLAKNLVPTIFVAIINVLVLFSAVVGIGAATAK